ncbi:unnamed protein product [[Actinomadura] parvosata subsp. kistnae]|nr:unnamed protein product [Actinomadura parvosata subsp. kistnae]
MQLIRVNQDDKFLGHYLPPCEWSAAEIDIAPADPGRTYSRTANPRTKIRCPRLSCSS